MVNCVCTKCYSVFFLVNEIMWSYFYLDCVALIIRCIQCFLKTKETNNIQKTHTQDRVEGGRKFYEGKNGSKMRFEAWERG